LLERRVVETIVRERRLRWPIVAHFESAIRGQTVRAVDRRAKYILIRFDTGTLILHLGMSGSLRLVKHGTPPKAHDHWDIRLDSGWILRFHDPRRFGSLLWTHAETANSETGEYGRSDRIRGGISANGDVPRGNGRRVRHFLHETQHRWLQRILKISQRSISSFRGHHVLR